jgi:hypothetical protein
MLAPLPYTYNVKNSIQLTEDLQEIPYESSIKMASFDIKSMYTNIPTSELIQILMTILATITQILILLKKS